MTTPPPEPAQTAEAPAACPAAFAMELVAHKWTIHILFALHSADAPVRFRELQRRTAPIAQKELTKRLRNLERSGLVTRRVFAQVPPRVEYSLTDLGRTLIPPLTALHEWSERHGGEVAVQWRRAEFSKAEHEGRPPIAPVRRGRADAPDRAGGIDSAELAKSP